MCACCLVTESSVAFAEYYGASLGRVGLSLDVIALSNKRKTIKTIAKCSFNSRKRNKQTVKRQHQQPKFITELKKNHNHMSRCKSINWLFVVWIVGWMRQAVGTKIGPRLYQIGVVARISTLSPFPSSASTMFRSFNRFRAPFFLILCVCGYPPFHRDFQLWDHASSRERWIRNYTI